MKLFKGLGLLSFLVVLSGSCFDPPEFPVNPQIEFVRVEFIDSSDDFDTLNLYLNFKDGDGDLGLSSQSLQHVSDPYQYPFYYQENNGKIEPLATETGLIGNHEYELLRIPDPAKGKLVVYRTRKKPEYNFLPVAETCGSNQIKYYEYLGGPVVDVDNPRNNTGRRLLVRASDVAVLDPEVQLVDSFPRTNPEYYQIRDTLYYTRNPNHNNIEVDFLVKDPTAPGGFREFDWYEEYCTTFDGRFTILSDSDNDNSVDGSLRYSMTSIGFTAIFSIKTLKLRVKIRDRALHESNVIETPEFTLH